LELILRMKEYLNHYNINCSITKKDELYTIKYNAIISRNIVFKRSNVYHDLILVYNLIGDESIIIIPIQDLFHRIYLVLKPNILDYKYIHDNSIIDSNYLFIGDIYNFSEYHYSVDISYLEEEFFIYKYYKYFTLYNIYEIPYSHIYFLRFKLLHYEYNINLLEKIHNKFLFHYSNIDSHIFSVTFIFNEEIFLKLKKLNNIDEAMTLLGIDNYKNNDYL